MNGCVHMSGTNLFGGLPVGRIRKGGVIENQLALVSIGSILGVGQSIVSVASIIQDAKPNNKKDEEAILVVIGLLQTWIYPFADKQSWHQLMKLLLC